MSEQVKARPEGYHSVTPSLVVSNASEAIDFYKKAFNAVELYRFPGPGGQGVMHAEIKIGDSVIMLGDEQPDWGTRSPTTLGGSASCLQIYVDDVDSAFEQAVAAGATAQLAPVTMFWGDRMSKVADPSGHLWSISTHVEDVTPEECTRRGEEFFAKMLAGAT